MSDQPPCLKKNRGRPKTFDRDAALDKALALFWQHGYEATSLADLVAATGAKAPTLYAEFVNKEGLFRAVLERYMEQFAAQRDAALDCPEQNVADAIEAFFRTTAACFSDGKTPNGCFIICTSTALAANSAEVAELLKSRHRAQEEALLRFLTQRQQRGELPAKLALAPLAEYLACLLQGMSVRAREGASTEALNRIIDLFMRQWPLLTQP
ncbi:TetR/AcrR family transcriptional regulator [Pantoea sp. 1.19]|uniref:TetR/AcrR family transcriptional regulator n=1 Tax=Pantoea sp. 1.19 TaxID=1925589 RepID=UPI000948B949|nr:TetR/AcrR family transcriptional regulator [Pantoea sp. 1.19]